MPKDQGVDEHLFESVYTDLAIEAHQVIVERQGGPEIPGVRVESEQRSVAKITRVTIETQEAANVMGKAQGRYVTLESTAIRTRNQEEQEQLSKELAAEIDRFLKELGIPETGGCLVVGLGNWNATPDALGPRTVSELLVTRHLHEMVPPELRGGLRPVAALAPGVLGLTGIETGEIVRGVVDRIRPALVICIDALAARSSDRLGSTIQLSDTGIQPGAGVGNVRKGISQASLGVPVLAIGVPTVIHAMTIVGDALDWIAHSLHGTPSPFASDIERQVAVARPVRLDPSRINVRENGLQWGSNTGETEVRTDTFGLPLDRNQKRFMIRQILGPQFGQMIVTPKEVDVLIDDIADCIAGAINTALHPALELDEILTYLQG